MLEFQSLIQSPVIDHKLMELRQSGVPKARTAAWGVRAPQAPWSLTAKSPYSPELRGPPRQIWIPGSKPLVCKEVIYPQGFPDRLIVKCRHPEAG